MTDTAGIALLRVLFSAADIDLLEVLFLSRPTVATKLMLLRLIDKIDAQITGGTTE